ncbi:MAG: 30S ribosomal protein S21 [Patescibacteria group bacterium]
MIEVKKKEGESATSLLFRFSKKVRQSGVMAEMRKRRFTGRPVSRRSRRLSALYRSQKRVAMARRKKLGLV